MPSEQPNAFGFDWDHGNREKCRKHGVSIEEIEFVLRRGNLRRWRDDLHSGAEERIRAFAYNAAGRAVFVVFTWRRKPGMLLIRPVSARYMHKAEVDGYEEDTARSQD